MMVLLLVVVLLCCMQVVADVDAYVDVGVGIVGVVDVVDEWAVGVADVVTGWVDVYRGIGVVIESVVVVFAVGCTYGVLGLLLMYALLVQ